MYINIYSMGDGMLVMGGGMGVMGGGIGRGMGGGAKKGKLK
jgi:hypothetical protein